MQHAILITLSQKRLSQLVDDPETLEDVVEARSEQPIPGLLDLGTSWDALDVLLSDRGKDAVLGDAVIGRTGEELDGHSFEDCRLLAPARVAEIAKALAALPAKLVADRYRILAHKAVHAELGHDQDEIAPLELILKRVIALYQDAARQKHAMLALRV
jgi:hypothetical protein